MSPPCETCGAPTRLVGIEDEDRLATYECADCSHFQVEHQASDGAADDSELRAFALREMRHRAQNLITVIQSIARLTLRSCDASETYKFQQRLVALGRAHTLTADAAWQGAPLSDIIACEFAAFPDNLTASGCEVVLGPEAVQQFSLIVHELTTNAIKHGSLSVLTGRVCITGKIEGTNGSSLFRFIWQETGGPTTWPPERKGFGSIMLEHAARNLGSAAMEFAPSGLRYELTIPFSAFAPPAARASAAE